MTSLAGAWRWYEAVRRQATLTRRLVGVHWDELPWPGRFGRDPHFRDLDPLRAGEDAEYVVGQLADLAVMVLFSVFEAMVRDVVLAAARPEAERLTNPALRAAAADALDAIAEGSFFRVLAPFKIDGHADLVEEVNQVRRYRNWVAHGRRGDAPASVSPEAARERLERFLSLIQPPAADPPTFPSSGTV